MKKFHLTKGLQSFETKQNFGSLFMISPNRLNFIARHE